MTKAIITISNYVDVSVQETQKDTKFFMFKSLEELDEYIQHAPIRANTLFFSKDAIPLANTSLNYLVSLLEKVFLRVDNVVYITETGSSEIDSVKFLIKDRGFDNWEIVQGALTREFVTGVINGNARDDFSNAKRKAVYRVPKSEYVRQQSRHSNLLEEERYKDDDESIQEMPNEKLPVYIPPEQVATCKSYDIIGHDIQERTLFVYIIGQYLSTHGKTLLLERDFDYHRLGEFVTKSSVDVGIYYVEDLYERPQQVLDEIRHDSHKLIVVLAKRRVDFSYNFTFNFLYNNLVHDIMYAVREGSFGEEPTEGMYTVVFPNTVPGVLSMCNSTDMNFVKYTKFVAIHTNTLSELRLPTNESISAIIEDVLNDTDIQPVELLSITSLELGGDDAYDLRSVLWE